MLCLLHPSSNLLIPRWVWSRMGTSPVIPAGFVDESWTIPIQGLCSLWPLGLCSHGKIPQERNCHPRWTQSFGWGQTPWEMSSAPALNPKAKSQQDHSVCPSRANPNPKLGLLLSSQTSHSDSSSLKPRRDDPGSPDTRSWSIHSIKSLGSPKNGITLWQPDPAGP